MKKLVKANLFISLFAISILSTSCRETPTPAPITEINLQCQRLATCFSSQGGLLTNPFVLNLIEDARKNNDPAKCQAASVELTKATNQECPF